MRRHVLAILSGVLIVVGLLLMPLDGQFALASFCWRIGIVLFVLWLALPQLQGVSVLLRRAAIVVAIIAGAFSKYGLILLPLIFLMWLFSGRKSPANENTNSAGESIEPNSRSN